MDLNGNSSAFWLFCLTITYYFLLFGVPQAYQKDPRKPEDPPPLHSGIYYDYSPSTSFKSPPSVL